MDNRCNNKPWCDYIGATHCERRKSLRRYESLNRLVESRHGAILQEMGASLFEFSNFQILSMPEIG